MIVLVHSAEGASGKQPVAEFHTPASGEVVVAGARLGQGCRPVVLPEGPHRSWLGDLSQRFQRRRNLLAGKLVVAVPALDPHADQPAVDEAAQMRSRRRRVNAGAARQFPGRESAAVSERGQHRGPRWIPEQSCHGSQIAVPGRARRSAVHAVSLRITHVISVPRAWFVPEQSVPGLASATSSTRPRRRHERDQHGRHQRRG